MPENPDELLGLVRQLVEDGTALRACLASQNEAMRTLVAGLLDNLMQATAISVGTAENLAQNTDLLAGAVRRLGNIDNRLDAVEMLLSRMRRGT